MALISCRDVAFAYEGHVAASGLNFSVDRGDFLSIVGENGSGKSTLMKGLLGLMKPQSGTISGAFTSMQIGYLPQQSAAQKNFPASAFEIVLSGRLKKRGIMPFFAKADRAAAQTNMDTLGIRALANKSYRELSGGQQQRVLLARALCAGDEVLMLDEPAAGLDPVVTRELYATLRDLSKTAELTIVMISHDIAAAVECAGYILHMRGKQVFFGRAADYLTSDVGRAFLGGGVGHEFAD